VLTTNRSTPWFVASVVALMTLVVIDMRVRLWSPAPARLPEQFSSTCLDLIVRRLASQQAKTIVVGDSVLWGYKLSESQNVIARLHSRLPIARFENLAFEGGSPPNSAIVVRHLVHRGVPIHAVLFNINQKEFNVADSAYRTLLPSLARVASTDLSPTDRMQLDPKMLFDRRGSVEQLADRYWRWYGLRVDLRERIFGADDAASAILRFTQRLSGESARAEAAHRFTADRFLGTYDLAPLDKRNVGLIYLRSLIAELCAKHIPALGFLTPTNHTLLADYIDSPEYEANLKTSATLATCPSVRIVNLDRAIPANEFIDNDHLTPRGNEHLARLLAPYLQGITQ